MAKQKKRYGSASAEHRKDAADYLKHSRKFAKEARMSLARGDCQTAFSDIVYMQEGETGYLVNRAAAGPSRYRGEDRIWKSNARIMGDFRRLCVRGEWK